MVAAATVLVLPGSSAAGDRGPAGEALLAYSLTIRVGVVPPSAGSRSFGGLCLTRPRGGAGTRLSSPLADYGPAWSRDGQRVAFARANSDGSDIVVADATGRNEMNLTRGWGFNSGPTWSPDGRRIAFTVFSYSGGASIAITDADGTNGRHFSHPGVKTYYDTSPAWSPDGTRLAFSGGMPGGRSSLYVADVDGTNGRLLASNADQPSWSPDGGKIAYIQYDGVRGQVATVNTDGTAVRLLTSGSEWNEGPSWSPDGRQIAFGRGKDADGGEIWLMNPDGSGQQLAISSRMFRASSPAWRPAAPLPPGGRPCIRRGTRRGDVIRGTAAGDLILGGAGNDTLRGEGGIDLLDGESGADLVQGGGGADVVEGGFRVTARKRERDRVLGGPGDDRLYDADGEPGLLDGGAGRDAAWYDLGIDRVKAIEDRHVDF